MGAPLRILHVVVNMNRGGAETLIMNLYRNINRSNVQFDFLTCKEGVFDKEIIEMGGRVHRIPYVTEAGHHGFTRKLRQFLTKHSEYKIVHSHMDKMSGFVLRSAKQAKVPIRIAHSHNTESEGGLFSKTYKWYAGSHVLPSATHLYACSHRAAEWLFGSKCERVSIVKNGIEIDTFKFSINTREYIRNELQLKQDTLVLGHIGRFSHQKNHMFLLDVFSRLNKEVPNSVLILVGDGSLRPQIESKIKELNLGKKVKLLGVRKDINQVLQAFDLFVFPSFHEGLPVTLIEAQGAGLPCVISSNITTEVDMGIGLVRYLPITDANVWLRSVIDVARKHQSRVIAQDAIVQKGYDIRKTAEQTEASYLSLGAEVI